MAKERDRDYKREYEQFHGKPKQKKFRAARNAARKKLGLKKGDPQEAHHKKALSLGGSESLENVKAVSKKANRKKQGKHGKTKETR